MRYILDQKDNTILLIIQNLFGFVLIPASHRYWHEMLNYINCFAIGDWNGLVPIGTLNGKNSIGYTLSAGTLSIHFLEGNQQSASETKCETSFFVIFLRVDRYPNIIVLLILFYCAAQGVSLHREINQRRRWLIWYIKWWELLFLQLFLLIDTRVRFVLTQKESAILYYAQKKLGIVLLSIFHKGKVGTKMTSTD
jgi:hypothetical protein